MNLIVFFTNNVSIKVWNDCGILDREIAIYKNLISSGIHVSFITYGDKIDFTFRNKLHGIQILCNRWGFKKTTYAKYLHIIHWKSLKEE